MAPEPRKVRDEARRAHAASLETVVRPVARASPLAGEGPPYLVIYVEDNRSNVALMESIVEDLVRVELLVATTAERGIALIRERRPDAVVMDIHLPGMSGIEAARVLAEDPLTRDIPVIALTAAAFPSDHLRASEAGFVRYLTKPMDVDDLTLALEQVLEPEG